MQCNDVIWETSVKRELNFSIAGKLNGSGASALLYYAVDFGVNNIFIQSEIYILSEYVLNFRVSFFC